MLPSPDRMTSGASSMSTKNPDGTPGAGNHESPSEAEATQGHNVTEHATPNYQEGDVEHEAETQEPGSPGQAHSYAHLTPQPQVVNYGPYPTQVTPASPSPGASAAVFPDAYGSFFRPPSAGAFMPHTNPFGGHPSPLSPPRPTTAAAATVSGVPPNSPLFPRLSGTQNVSTLHPNGLDRVMQQPPSPTLAYTTVGAGYQGYATANVGMNGNLQQTGSDESATGTPGGWMDAR